MHRHVCVCTKVQSVRIGRGENFRKQSEQRDCDEERGGTIPKSIIEEDNWVLFKKAWKQVEITPMQGRILVDLTIECCPPLAEGI